MDDCNMPKVGDKIRVVVAPHMPGQSTGIIRQALHGLLGIEFDSAPGEVHQWYSATEVMVTEPAPMPAMPAPAEEMRSGGSRAVSANLASFAAHRAWLIIPEVLTSMCLAMRERLAGKSIELPVQSAAMTRPKSVGKIAVLPLHGVIQQRADIWMEIFGGTSTDQFGAMFDEVIRDPSVKGVIVDIDSPGGTVPGVMELSDKIFAARGSKPIVGIANSMAASAAYWVGTAFDRLYVSPGGNVGSVGVRSEHYDWSKYLENLGIKSTVFQVPKYKAEFHPDMPLSEESIAYEQGEIERIYGDFVGAVARNRGTTPANVRKSYGEGRLVDAKAAVSLGMADKVATLEQVISRMASGRIKTDGPSASDEWGPEPVLTDGAADVGDDDWRMRNAAAQKRSELRRKGVLS